MTNFGIIDLYSNGINIEIGGITVGEIVVGLPENPDRKDEENDAAIRFPRPRSRTLGSGRMVVNPKKTLVHFGSPVGTQFSSTDENPEWLF